MANRNPLTQEEQKALLKIAQEHIYEMKNRRSFEAAYRVDVDFLEVVVWSLEVALTEAYLLGKKNASKN